MFFSLKKKIPAADNLGPKTKNSSGFNPRLFFALKRAVFFKREFNTGIYVSIRTSHVLHLLLPKRQPSKRPNTRLRTENTGGCHSAAVLQDGGPSSPGLACSQEESRLLECSSDFTPELGAMRDTSKTPQVRVASSNLAADERMHHKGSPWATQDRSHQRQRQTLCAS